MSKEQSKRKSSSGHQQSDAKAKPVLITTHLLQSKWRLPQPSEDGDKEERGSVLIVGGATAMPGAVILAATGALRAGAGKLQIATCRSIASLVAAAVPESCVFALPETKTGDIAHSAWQEIAARANKVQAVLIGPGIMDESAATKLMRTLLPRIEHVTVILDAAALACLSEDSQALHMLGGRAVVTPHAGEMASMLGIDKKLVLRDAHATALQAASDLHAVVALKGSSTYIAAPDGAIYCNRSGNIGLATSGSGDTLSGIITGLAARGCPPLQAAMWGVYLHAQAGDRLAKQLGKLGFLARELLAEVPVLMAKFD